jgi:hypothetical protein
MLRLLKNKWFWIWFCIGAASAFAVFTVIGTFPTYEYYCAYHGEYKDCSRYLFVLYPAVWITDHLDLVASGITAVATWYIARFTGVIRSINTKQLATTEDVERAYLSGGGAPHLEEIEPISIPEMGKYVPNIASRGRQFRQTGWFRLDINNHGKTRGNILEYGYGFCAPDKVGELPEKPVYRWVYYYDQIGPGTQSRPIKKVKIPDGQSVIYGRYGYRDIFDKYHSDGFIQDGWNPIAPPHKSYTEADPDWDIPNIGHRKYEKEEPQS